MESRGGLILVLGSSDHEPGGDPSWSTFLSALSGWHEWYRLREAWHYRFIDLGGSVRKWGLEEQFKPTDPGTWRRVFGDIGDEGSQRIVIDLTSAFFNRFLRWWPSPVLENLTKRFPEVIDMTGTI